MTRFQNASGIPVGGYLDLLWLYLGSAMIEREGKVSIQKSSVCIGSCLAPIPGEIYLFFVDRAVQEHLARSGNERRVFRCVDEYLVLHPVSNSVISILQAFKTHATL